MKKSKNESLESFRQRIGSRLPERTTTIPENPNVADMTANIDHTIVGEGRTGRGEKPNMEPRHIGAFQHFNYQQTGKGGVY